MARSIRIIGATVEGNGGNFGGAPASTIPLVFVCLGLILCFLLILFSLLLISADGFVVLSVDLVKLDCW